ncbi:MAG: hypothetical protein HZA50_08890 [Planctomycetes bacterium]|nr:hypothetical protein [Planctomycetota bacterium]
MNRYANFLLVLAAAASISLCSCKDPAKERQKTISDAQNQAGSNIPPPGGTNNGAGQPDTPANTASYRASDLVGTWVYDNGAVVLASDGRYESYIDGVLKQTGTWSVSQDKLSFASSDGQQETDTLKSLTSNKLTVMFADGRTTVWGKTAVRPGQNRQTLTAEAFAGTWTATNGAAIVFSGNGRFESYAGGELVSRGAFGAQDQTLVLKHPNGAVESYTVKMREGSFTATDGRGNSLVYTRSRQ